MPECRWLPTPLLLLPMSRMARSALAIIIFLASKTRVGGFLPIFWDAPSAYMHAATCCQQLHNPTLVTSQVRVQELRQLSQHDQTNCPVLDSQEVHKSSWEGTARRCTGRRPQRHRSFKLSLQFKLATGKVVGVRRAVYPGGGPRNGRQSQ